MTAAVATAGLRTIRVYGTLARLIGRRELRATVSSVPEAMRFLLANFPQVEGHLKGRFFKVKVASWSLTEHDLEAPIGQTEDVHIIPAICGAGGDGPLVGILAGAALIGVGLLVPFTGSLLVPLGIGLVLNGVAALLSPTPDVADEDNDPARSYNFSNIQQTSREGVPVPLIYGDIVTGSVVLSVNIEKDDEELEEIFVEGPGSASGSGPEPEPTCRKYYLEVYMSDNYCNISVGTGDSILTDTSSSFFQATIPTIGAANSLKCSGGLAPKGAQGGFTILVNCAGEEVNSRGSLNATSLGQGNRQYAGHRIWTVDDGYLNYNNPILVQSYVRNSTISPLPAPGRPGFPT